MPDVTRSDSQRSDTSLRPRVSFNRDVHVKRIVPREAARSALVSNDEGHFGSLVRKERLPKNKDQLKKEAAKVIDQVDKIDCITKDKGVHPEKFYTLPARRKTYNQDNETTTEKRTGRRNSIELPLNAPKKPPRTFAQTPPKPQRSSIFNIFQDKTGKQKETVREAKPKKSNLRRSVSDASNLKSSEKQQGKKQLSPIIEDSPRADYFTGLKASTSFKENDRNVENKPTVTEQLKKYIDEIDSGLNKTTLNEKSVVEESKRGKETGVVIIDVDKAEKISEKGNKSKLNGSSIGRKLKSIAGKKGKKAKEENAGKEKGKRKEKPTQLSKDSKQLGKDNQRQSNKDPQKLKGNNSSQVIKGCGDLEGEQLIREADSIIKEAIENLENQSKKPAEMIHSSQQPVEKLPLTRGRTVDTMVKRLSHENGCSPPPPKATIMVSPNVNVQHNNNQPFSYTRALSPVIYAQVVCGNDGSNTKQTVHAVYTNGKKQLPHSDSDEGLGYEEGVKNGTRKYYHHHHNNNNEEEEYPITPSFKNNGFSGKYSKGEYAKEHEVFNHHTSKEQVGFTTKQYSKDQGIYLDSAVREHKMYTDSSPKDHGIFIESPTRDHIIFTDSSPKDQGIFVDSSPREHGIFIDSSSRGRGDGMDAKRRESLTEPLETSKLHANLSASRKDLSARRDLLESRINRRFTPEYPPKANVYVTETTSRYYRSGSASPIREKLITETKTDRHGVTTKKYLVDGYGYDNEPKSFDSQASDYRSSPENPRKFTTSQHTTTKQTITSKNDRLTNARDFYKSNPEIAQRYDSYQNATNRRYYEYEPERKDKFGDSGIENDFRDHHRRAQRRELSNESEEDEGFASSLLIASERQHTEDNFHGRKNNNRRSYESDRSLLREDEEYHQHHRNGGGGGGEYRSYRNKNEYIPRERSIDDGSHFDPRIDKNVEKERSSTLRKVENKPPKPEKKSSLEKMKQLFSSSKKKKDKPGMVREESLRARYTEYKGHHPEPKIYKKEVTEANTTRYDYNNRRRLSTPSPSPTREQLPRNGKTDSTHGSWFKSLDRLSRKKTKKDEKDGGNMTSTEEEVSKPTKSLRFFGDTDIESNDSVRHKSALKSRSGLSHRDRLRSQSSRDLHNISEETLKSSGHKSMLNISAESERDVKGSRLSLKPPASPSHRNREASRSREDRNRRRKNEVSSVESSTEGDSSQQSQRSVVYLHAATVGDIPGPGYLRNGRRAASREELTSNSSSRIQPQVKTLSRSFSVLAPWKPKHYKEGMDIDYTQYPSKPVKNGKYEQNRNGSSRKDTSSSTLKKKAQETRRSNQQSASTLNRRSRSKENVSSTLKRTSESKGSSSSLYKKRERQPKDNNRYSSSRDDRKFSAKSMSVESLGSRKSDREISRSISMPRDPEKSAGWFTMTKKSKKSGSTQRL